MPTLHGTSDLSRFRYLVTLVGFSPEPVVSVIEACAPERVLFICTPESEEKLDTILPSTGLAVSRIEKRVVEGTDTAGVYRAIRDFVKSVPPEAAACDITGGKKAMTAAAAMAAALTGIAMIYVDYAAYDEKARRPRPGTERVVRIENPYTVFGDVELEKALSRLRHHDYEGALVLLEDLETKVDALERIRSLRIYVEALCAWDRFDYAVAREGLAAAAGRKEIPGVPEDVVRRQAEIVDILAGDGGEREEWEVLNFFFAGLRFAARGRFDVGVFMMYRVMERVGELAYRGNALRRKENEEGVRDAYVSFCRMLHGKADRKCIPRKKGLLDTYICLCLGRDPFVPSDRAEQEAFLRNLKSIAELRNNSIFAHGTRPLAREDFERIRAEAEKLMNKFLGLRKFFAAGRGRNPAELKRIFVPSFRERG